LTLFGIYVIARRSGANPRALEGSRGLIAEHVDRFDERMHVFARNRSLHPGSERYRQFYREHPEKEALDAARRKKGGPIGHPGTIAGFVLIWFSGLGRLL